jgi:hypothetical protein
MRTSLLAVIVISLGTSASASAQESILQKLLSGPPKPAAQVQAVRYTAPAPPVQCAASPVSVLPAVPLVVPAAQEHARRLPCTQTTPSSCDKVGLLRGILASGHAFFQMPTGHGFCGLH